tara:strand:+ start:740 stop:1150 length:411 start_codon:yes stop_codon:yes gene_type:complete
MKKCTKCGETKDVAEFNRKYGKPSSDCKECHREIIRRHYRENKGYYVAKAKKRTNEVRDWFRELKSTLVCSECGEDHPATIDFHHIDPQEKEINICHTVAQGWSPQRIEKEIAKCKILCANCHRILHWEEKLNMPD